MKLRQSVFALFLYLLLICALFLFLNGFFPIDDGTFQGIAQHKNNSRPEKPLISKLVLLIIDAVRVDFVDPGSGRHLMPFLQSSILKNESCLMRLQTAAPTVTMPRLKAITSGAIPSYIDVVMNLGSAEFQQDTFLRQASLQGLNLVFYGDDTWLKMFPTLFVRSSGTHSFFAADFWEVDQNVTREVNKELARDDWDIMILHYLGLDHIGHMEGPSSSHVAPKLAEMDAVVHKIHSALREKETMILVTGDHGMKDSGGHGGVTDAEINVPLVSVGRACGSLPGWPHHSGHSPLQVDLASTLAIALGLRVPGGNMGKLIPALLSGMPSSKIMLQLKSIKRLLLERCDSLNFLKDEFNKTDFLLDAFLESGAQDINQLRDISSKYFSELSTITREMTRNRSDFNVPYLALACIALWALLITYFLFLCMPWPCNALQIVLAGGTFGHTASLASSSFIEEEHQTWYFLWVTLVVLFVRERWRRKVVVGSYVLDIKSCSLLMLAIMHRLLRKLNQTGDKWASIPDWDRFFRTNPLPLFLLFLSGIAWMYLLFKCNHNWKQRVSFAVALLSIAAYRLAVGSFRTLSLNHVYPQSKGSKEVTVFFGALAAFCYQSAKPEGPSASWAWGLLAALTLRPHNLVIVPAHVFLSRQLYHVFMREENVFWNTLAHVWTGYLFYFYQGNSNGLANIDVTPAFIGCDSYNAMYAAFMTAVHTFAGPVHAILLSPRAYNPILLSRLLPLAVYCSLVTTQRHHLFVWSVFSPKLLLDSTLTFVLFIVLCLLSIDRLRNNRPIH